jgi:response regulator RpfG family c-di-GMP phosphodiesterase
MSATAPTAAAPQPAPRPSATLLCVDDEPNILSALRRLFRPHGYQVHVAGGGAEGLALLERTPVDLVISDMRMPEMNGAEFLERVRARWPDTVRILLTGFSDLDSTVAAINEGQIARYVAKPWDDDTVLTIVREQLEKKFLLAERRRLEALTAAQNDELKNLNATLEQKVEARTAQLAAALKNAEAARAALHRSLLNSVRVYASFLELRAPAIAAHCKRVAERVRTLAQKMSLASAAVQDAVIAALLHDIGRVSLPDEALAAPAQSLTGAARDEHARHPARGAELLAILETTQGAAETVRAHHERFDGSGFPAGLRGSEIPLAARILAVADDFDEAVAGLLMRPALAPANALRWLQEGRGRRYDPAVLDAFAALFGEPADQAPKELVLRPAQLEPGMVLARDIVAPGGKLLLVSDYALDAELIDGLVNYERSIGSAIRVTVRLAPAA